MSIFSTKRIKTASKDRSKINLSSHVITTNDFGFSMPIYAREVVPGDKWSINLKTFARLAPLPVPTLSSIKIINRAYYVRFRNVWKDWEAFYERRSAIGDNGTSYMVEEVPTFSNADFCRVFFGNGFTSTQKPSSRPEDTVYAKIVDQPADVTTAEQIAEWKSHRDVLQFQYCWDFTPLGRRVLSLFRSLGYNFNFVANDITRFSLLPLLCYCRTFYDYVLPSKYSNDELFRSIFLKQIQNGVNSFRVTLEYVVKGLFNFYENDYFTSSWTTPFLPDSDAQTTISVSTLDYENRSDSEGSIMLTPNKMSFTPFGGAQIEGDSNGLSYISKYAMDSMNALYNWGIRRGLGGNKYFELIFSGFGIKLPNVLTNRCEFLGGSTQVVQISDVMSTAQTENGNQITALGDYAGKGISYSPDGRVSFEANDYGYVIITSQIIPETGYTQGRSREVMHIDRLDYFDGSFDCMGMQAVRNDELYSDYRDTASYQNGNIYGGNPSSIFGYVPRFTEYKCGRDLLNGDFRIRHLNTGLESYHTFRLFAPPSQENPLANTLSFRQINPENNGSDFDRIFNQTDNVADHFIMEFDINVSVMRKMKSVQDSIEIDGGQTITVDPDNNLSN